VHLNGFVKPQASGTGSTTVVFTLPRSYRPAALKQFAVLIVNAGPTNALGRVEAQAGGNVVMYDNVGIWFSLNGITFKAEQ
jgi:hypothetical protein